jgi:P-type Cu2+ transporter
VRAIELSRATYRKMVQNLLWATVYNVVAVPVAEVFIRLDLPMSLGAMPMSFSAIIVAGAQRAVPSPPELGTLMHDDLP